MHDRQEIDLLYEEKDFPLFHLPVASALEVSLERRLGSFSQ